MIYIHVLQPNQYVKGSKPLSEKEQKIAIDPTNEWGIVARNGYGNLITGGKKLKDKGIPFYDFTAIFQDSTDDIYIDTCCHFGQNGYAIMAKHLANIVIEIVAGRDLQSSP